MYLQALKNIMVSKGLNRADVARLAGVSRAAVSKWFRQGEKTGVVNVETKTIIELARTLKLPPDIFLKELENLSAYETEFLWDRLYPDMEHFLKAVAEGRLPALARLVQVLGFHQAGAVAGKKVIRLFHKYKKHIHPTRRRALEVIWSLYAN